MSLTTNTSSSMSRSGTTKRSPAAGVHNTPAFRSRPACSIVITPPSSPPRSNAAGPREPPGSLEQAGCTPETAGSAVERGAEFLRPVGDAVAAFRGQGQVEQGGRLQVSEGELRAQPTYRCLTVTGLAEQFGYLVAALEGGEYAFVDLQLRMGGPVRLGHG